MNYERAIPRERNEAENVNAIRATEYAARMRAAMSDVVYTLPEASLRLPFDEGMLDRSRALVTKLVGHKLAYILVIGIGGSNLGTKAIYEASSGVLDPHTPFAPKMLFADTCSSELLTDIVEILLDGVSHKDEIIIVVASKSGTTTETIMNASILLPALEAKLGSLAERVVCVTDEDSPLWKVAGEHGFHTLAVPRAVGGRYSVFSPAGIFPLLCAGVDVRAMFRGAQEVVHECVENGAMSKAYFLAEDIFAWHTAGVRVLDLFLFHPELESAGKWYRQLFAESLGKNIKSDGNPALQSLVPTVSLGSTDLHSAEQMHLANSKLVARILVRAHSPHWEHQFLASDAIFAPIVPEVVRRAPCEVMDAIYQAVRETYQAHGVSFGEIKLPDLDPESLGAFLQLQMCTVMHLGQLFAVNAFDQPNVEEYKNAVRKILGA